MWSSQRCWTGTVRCERPVPERFAPLDHRLGRLFVDLQSLSMLYCAFVRPRLCRVLQYHVVSFPSLLEQERVVWLEHACVTDILLLLWMRLLLPFCCHRLRPIICSFAGFLSPWIMVLTHWWGSPSESILHKVERSLCQGVCRYKLCHEQAIDSMIIQPHS